MDYQLELQALGEIMIELRKLQKNIITANAAQLKVEKYEYGSMLEKAKQSANYNDSVVNRSRPQVIKTVEQKLKQYKEHYTI